MASKFEDLPSNGDMDQDMAQVLFHQGAMLVFMDVPQGTEFGIDYNSWKTGPNFRGIKMIPPGIHFVFYSAVNSDNQAAPRTGFFYDFKPKQVLIKKWNKRMEGIESGEVNIEEQQNVEQNKMELDRYLAPFPYESYKKWVSLTHHITQDVVTRLQPLVEGVICSVSQFQSQSSNTKERQEQSAKMETEAAPNTRTLGTEDDSRLPQMKLVEGTEIRFTQIPRQKYPEGATAVEITKYNMDHSYVLKTITEAHLPDKEGKEILGELQFAFICFLLGQVYDAFEQWKKIVHLLCSCDEALATNTDLFLQFISVLHHQIKEIPEDFFVDIVSRNNFLTSTLQQFFSNLDSEYVDSTLRTKGLRFRDHLQKRFQWDFTADPDEDQPVIVDM